MSKDAVGINGTKVSPQVFVNKSTSLLVGSFSAAGRFCVQEYTVHKLSSFFSNSETFGRCGFEGGEEDLVTCGFLEVIEGNTVSILRLAADAISIKFQSLA